MKRALIATVFNEADGIQNWAATLRAQTVHPDEFVIVDGGSTDGTPDLMRKVFAAGGFPQPRIIVQRCNIAQGRNLAIRQTDAEIIASSDAGSSPEPEWFGEITRPLMKDPRFDVIGGYSIPVGGNSFQNLVLQFERPYPNDVDLAGVYTPSGRCTAFRRQAWEAVGGYPEWLTLTAEDSLQLRIAQNRKVLSLQPASGRAMANAGNPGGVLQNVVRLRVRRSGGSTLHRRLPSQAENRPVPSLLAGVPAAFLSFLVPLPAELVRDHGMAGRTSPRSPSTAGLETCGRYSAQSRSTKASSAGDRLASLIEHRRDKAGRFVRFTPVQFPVSTCPHTPMTYNA